MALYTRCILSPRNIHEGVRISVMSRHTLNDGITPDTRISSDCYDEWKKVLAAPARLVGAYYKKELSWEIFAEEYQKYLEQPVIDFHVQHLARDASNTNITLLCIEETADYCHRRLLAERCHFYYPKLEIIHR